MENILEVDDPRGFHVILTSENWEKHVLLHHPEMKNRLEQVAKTIQKPFPCICQDRWEDNCIVYYSKPDRLYIRIVVQIMPKGYGMVNTAYRCRSPKSGESILWMAPNN